MTPSPTTNPILRTVDAAGHLALWVGAYAAAWMCATAWLLGVALEWRVIAAAGLATIAVYLLDRIKIRNAAIDPADIEAHPRRLDFLKRHAVLARSLMVIAALAAASIAWSVTPAIGPILIVAGIGVWLYGSMPRRPRVKDRLVVKNAAVAVCMAMFFLVLTLFGEEPNRGRYWPEHWPSGLVTVGLFLAMHIFADAMLCDLDDSSADAAHGTQTIVNRVGELRTWGIALLLASGAGAITIFETLTREASSVENTTLFGVAVGVAMVKLVLAVVRLWVFERGAWVRDAIDLHVPLVMAVVFVWRAFG